MLKAMTVIVSLSGFLSSCDTTTAPPDISSLQLTPQEQNQEYIQKSLQS